MNSLIDTYRTAFLKFLADGMNHAEALDQFDRKEMNLALNAALENGEYKDRGDGEDTLFDLVVKAGFVKRNSMGSPDMEQALALWAAGWTSEVPNPTKSDNFWSQPQVMSYYWRRPSRRSGKPGRKYLSTNQAYNAMMKETH